MDLENKSSLSNSQILETEVKKNTYPRGSSFFSSASTDCGVSNSPFSNSASITPNKNFETEKNQKKNDHKSNSFSLVKVNINSNLSSEFSKVSESKPTFLSTKRKNSSDNSSESSKSNTAKSLESSDSAVSSDSADSRLKLSFKFSEKTEKAEPKLPELKLSEDHNLSNNLTTNIIENTTLKKVPIQKLIQDNKNVMVQNFPELILREKLKKDFFSSDCKLSLQEMMEILKKRAKKIEEKEKLEKEEKEKVELEKVENLPKGICA